MPQAKLSDVPTPKTEELRREYVMLFLAELMQVTGTPNKQADFQAALQTYCDRLRPWLDPSDGPTQPRAVFSLLEHCEFDESGEQISVILSPEAEALFRAWLRRNKVLNEGGFNTAHAWSN
jgi:hypothetical protein